MASTVDPSAATPTPNQYAERLLPYLRTYPAQGSTQASFIKAWVAILGGMARNPQLGRPGYRPMPPCLTIDAMLVVDDSVNPNAFITSDWWGYWGPVLPALIKFLLPVAMDGTGTWPHPRTDGQFNEACRRSMEESFVQDPNITPTAYAKTIAKTSKAFNLAWVQAMNPLVEYNIMGRIMKGPDLEQLLANHFMEDGMFQYINDRIGSWAGRLQKACEENPTTTMVQLLQGRSPAWWAWSLSRGFLGALSRLETLPQSPWESRKCARWPRIS